MTTKNDFHNPRTYKQSHTLTVLQGGGGVMLMEFGPLGFSLIMLQYIERISSLVESLWSALQDVVHIMGCHTAGGTVTSSKMAAILGEILDFTEI